MHTLTTEWFCYCPKEEAGRVFRFLDGLYWYLYAIQVHKLIAMHRPFIIAKFLRELVNNLLEVLIL